MLTREELALLALKVLDLQKTYFRIKPGDPGKVQALEASKAIEKELRHECARILEGPTLFGEDS
jgi:hypothetical protein